MQELPIKEMIDKELNSLKEALNNKEDSQDTVFIINSLIEKNQSVFDLDFAYSQLQAIRHFVKLIHGVSINENQTLRWLPSARQIFLDS